jgi:hypothetical protein
MTYTLTVNAGTRNFIAPTGQRYRAADGFTLADSDFGRLTAGARSVLTAGAGGTSTGSLGGTVSHQVTIHSGLKNVVLPNGLRYPAGAVVVLSDAEYSLIPAAALATLFSADTTTLT